MPTIKIKGKTPEQAPRVQPVSKPQQPTNGSGGFFAHNNNGQEPVPKKQSIISIMGKLIYNDIQKKVFGKDMSTVRKPQKGSDESYEKDWKGQV